MNDLRLVVFDVDGTLVDSQGDIVGSMNAAFADHDLETPTRKEILAIVGLSLDVAISRLAPSLDEGVRSSVVDAYKEAYAARRSAKGSAQSSPLYEGAREALNSLHIQPLTLLGVATGKSRRGLDNLIKGHGLEGLFVTQQVADHHPSKPNPSMLNQTLADTGADRDRAVMVGDTSFDMEMAKAAGFYAIGVSWGYHEKARLASADVVIDSFAELIPTLESYFG